MKVWLDDERPAPPGWRRCRTPREVIELLMTGDVTELSLDHDLGLIVAERERTGYDVLLWLEQEVAGGRTPPSAMSVHSANPVARRRMLQAIEAIQRMASVLPGTPPARLSTDVSRESES
jgi:hypothetical protein